MGDITKKQQGLVKKIIAPSLPQLEQATAFAPSNIALCKYWGKRDQVLNLPVTSSLSISLGDKGTKTTVKVSNENFDQVKLNSKVVAPETEFYQRLQRYLDLFRPIGTYFAVETQSNIPTNAGLASSASGFAALTKALAQLFAWDLPLEKLSILARLGSGSACRSLWDGFVLWDKGCRQDGTDSFAKLLPVKWPELRVGLLIFSAAEKKISSRAAMQITVEKCPYYALWPAQVSKTLDVLQQALEGNDFSVLGAAAETNCLEMHALMLASSPPILYSNADTLAAMNKVWELRAAGVEVYFTQDAGPNLKLLFKQQDQAQIAAEFPNLTIVSPWK